jgi:hypothetical protein
MTVRAPGQLQAEMPSFSRHMLAYENLFVHEEPAAPEDASPALSPLGQEIEGILAKPMIEKEGGSSQLRSEFTFEQDALLKRIIVGQVQLPRLAALHRLLCGRKSPQETFAIENGPGGLIHTTAALRAMGTAVLVKEIDASAFRIFEDGVRRLFPRAFREGLAYAIDVPSVGLRTPADIAYWVNPEPGMFSSDIVAVAGYMGRDVRPGGYLVIQSDILRRRNFRPDPAAWERIYFNLIEGLVYPTTIWDMDMALIVLRRREAMS